MSTEPDVLSATIVEEPIAAGFERAVGAHGTRVAVADRHHAFTYDALNRAANLLARVIRDRSAGAARPVALLAANDAPALVAILAALKAGAIYAVLDPRAPRARLTSMMQDAAPGVIVAARAHVELAAALQTGGDGIHLVEADALPGGVSDANLGLAIAASAPAVISYTSGSTGAPRGVVSAHRDVLHRAVDFANTARVTPADRLAILNSLATGASFRDTFAGLLTGATICPYDVGGEGLAALPGWLVAQRITVCHCAASLFRHFAATAPGGRFPDLRVVWVGHEPVRPSDVELARARLGADCMFINGMGISEAGTVCHVALDRDAVFPDDVVPVGLPIPGKEVLVLDDAGRDVGVDGVGEIVVRSEYLAQGYWGRPDLTAEVFRPDPRGGPARLYRTGDLGRRLSDGSLVLLGRKNALTKVGGEFVDLLAVESALLRHPDVRGAVAIVREDRPAAPRLTGYVVASPPPTWTALRDLLKEALPPHMMPSKIVYVDELPRAPNGKIDRRALPAPDRGRPRLRVEYAPPLTLWEARLAAIWGEALELDEVGIHDDFLELGGDSLRAARVMQAIGEQLGVDVPLTMLLAAPTVAEMAIALAERLLAGHSPEAVSRLVAEPASASDHAAGLPATPA